MIPRLVSRHAGLIQGSSFASSSRVSARHFSSALTRPSPIALGKRPVGVVSTYGSSLGVRHFSLVSGTNNDSKSVPPTVNQASAPIAEPVQPQTPTPPTSQPVDTSAIDALAPVSTPTPIPSPVTPSAEAIPTGISETVVRTVPDATLTEIITLNPEIPLETLLRTPEAIAAHCTRADLASLDLTHSWYNLAGWTRDGLVNLHEMTGLPWWATIAVTVVMIRSFLVRPLIKQNKNNIKMAALGPQIKALTDGMKAAQTEKNQAKAAMYQKALTNLMVEHDVNPLRNLKMPLMQLPIFLSMFYGLRGLAEVPLPGLVDGGLGWFRDLSISDPYLILPFTSMLLTATVIRTGADGTGSPSTAGGYQAHMKNILTGFTAIGFLFISWFGYPAAVLFYWTCTNAFTLIQATILRQPAVQKYLGMPKVDIAPPPGNVKLTSPTFVDTYKAGRDGLKDMYLSRRMQAEKSIANHNQLAGNSQTVKSYMANETIREKKSATRPKSGGKASYTPPPRRK